MTTLESKGYVASDADIAALATSVLSAVQESDNGRRSYLRTLVATTQKALGSEPRQRSGKPARLDPEGVNAQLKALAAIHERFYAIILKVAGETVPTGTKDRGIEMNRRTNFARTAMSAIRSWVRAGNDLTTLGARSVTKAALAVKRTARRVPSAQSLKTKVERVSKDLVGTLMVLADTNRVAAVEEMQLVMGQLANQLAEMGAAPTRDVEQAVKEHMPFRMKSTIFVPTSTQVIRQQVRPS